MKSNKIIKTFEEHSENLNISDVITRKMLTDIDNKENKYYVGYIDKDGLSSWVHDGIFKGFSNHEDVIKYINDLKEDGIKAIKIFSMGEYNEMMKLRMRGY